MILLLSAALGIIPGPPPAHPPGLGPEPVWSVFLDKTTFILALVILSATLARVVFAAFTRFRQVADTRAKSDSVLAELNASAAPYAASKWSPFFVILTLAFVLLGALLCAQAALYWKYLVANVVLVVFVIETAVFMVLGILTQLWVACSKTGRDPRTLSASDVVYPLMASFLIFYSFWHEVLLLDSKMACLYTAFTSGLAWRGFLEKGSPETRV